MGKLCRSCDQDVFWAQSELGRPVLLNSDVNMEEGNVRVVGTLFPSKMDKVIQVLTRDEVGVPSLDPDEERYVVHFATCPGSREWSGERR